MRYKLFSLYKIPFDGFDGYLFTLNSDGFGVMKYGPEDSCAFHSLSNLESEFKRQKRDFAIQVISSTGQNFDGIGRFVVRHVMNGSIVVEKSGELF